MPILTVNNLYVRMGVQEILRGINIKIEKKWDCGSTRFQRSRQNHSHARNF